MSITIQKNCPGEGVMSHNHPPLYGRFVLGGIYLSQKSQDRYIQVNQWLKSVC